MTYRESASNRQWKTFALIALAAFLLINGCSWQPGYGGRNDGRPGAEVERFFGWPACFYADLWQSDEPIDLLNLEPWDYAPPLPITTEMHFVYCRFGVLPLLLDAVLVAAGTGVFVILSEWDRRGELCMRSVVIGCVLVLVGWAIVRFGDQVSVFL